MRWIPSSNYFLCVQWTNLVSPSFQKKIKLLRLSRIKGSILKYRVPSLWPTYKGDKGTTFVKAYGIKVKCYWELFGEHVRNLGTLCFRPPRLPPPPHPKNNNNKKKNLHRKFTVHCPSGKWPPSPTTRKKGRPPSVHSTTSHWLHGN
jgi:hypothetical protein